MSWLLKLQWKFWPAGHNISKNQKSKDLTSLITRACECSLYPGEHTIDFVDHVTTEEYLDDSQYVALLFSVAQLVSNVFVDAAKTESEVRCPLFKILAVEISSLLMKASEKTSGMFLFSDVTCACCVCWCHVFCVQTWPVLGRMTSSLWCQMSCAFTLSN